MAQMAHVVRSVSSRPPEPRVVQGPRSPIERQRRVQKSTVGGRHQQLSLGLVLRLRGGSDEQVSEYEPTPPTSPTYSPPPSPVYSPPPSLPVALPVEPQSPVYSELEEETPSPPEPSFTAMTADAKTSALTVVFDTWFERSIHAQVGCYGWVLDEQHLLTLSATGRDLRDAPSVAWRRENHWKYGERLAWVRRFDRFVSVLAARYQVPESLMKRLLDWTGDAPAFASQLFIQKGATGSVYRAEEHVENVIRQFQGFRSSYLGVRPHHIIEAVALAEEVFGADLRQYLQALYHLHFWTLRATPTCIERLFKRRRVER